jgi:hypothetical protein
MTKRTHCGPRQTKFSATGKRSYKRPEVIAFSDVATCFDEACIRKLATIAQLPPSANLQDFGWYIREAAEMFVVESQFPTRNEVRSEIASLHDAAEHRDYDEVARLREVLTQEASAFLPQGLPSVADLRDNDSRDAAAGLLASLCRIGGELVEGRHRSSGEQSSAQLAPILCAPAASRNVSRREAERNFVERLSIAFWEVTGKRPPRTARRADAGRELGPFAQFVKECLRLVGAGYADPVGLINAVGARLETE